jgi:hypothetical protein
MASNAKGKSEKVTMKISIKNMPFASFFVRAIPARKEIKLSDAIMDEQKKTKKLATKKAPAKKKAPVKKAAKKK